VMRCRARQVPSKEVLARLWLHECMRVFHDRLVNMQDRRWFTTQLVGLASTVSGSAIDHDTVMYGKNPILFVDFLRPPDDDGTPIYEEARDFGKVVKILNDSLEDYNITHAKKMELVFFRDAVEHVCRIARVLRQPRGHALLVGVGGSGRQSLTRVASYIADFKCIQIEITRSYGRAEWREDLKRVLMTAGAESKPVVFLFSDTQIVQESFLEDINNILNSGEVPNLYEPDELERIVSTVRPLAKAAGKLETRDVVLQHYVHLVRENLHVVLAFSPIGEAFRRRLRMFPSIINCCTVDWYNAWPEDALFSVAHRFLAERTELGIEQYVTPLCNMAVRIHRSVEEATQSFFAQLRRHNYTTPTSYLELIRLYVDMLGKQRDSVSSKVSRYRGGLQKLAETEDMVAGLQEELRVMQPKLVKAQEDTAKLLAKLEVDQEKAAAARELAQKDEAAAKEVAAEVKAMKDDCQRDLDEALPAYYSAIEALDKLDKKSIQEVKSFANPPQLVLTTLEAVCVLMGVKPTWAEAKKLLNDMQFLDKLKTYDKDNVPAPAIRKLKKYMENPDFTPDKMRSVSTAATSLCMWVRAMWVYDKVAKNIAPKREALAVAEKRLEGVMADLREKQAALRKVEAEVAALQAQYEDSVRRKQELERQQERTRKQLERAEKLIGGLGAEKVRWTETAEALTQDQTNLVGNMILSAGLIAYAGPFTAEFRRQLAAGWVTYCNDLRIPVDAGYSLQRILADPVEVRAWNLMGLPADEFSTENGMFATRGRRWPLMVDPQGQANRWVKNMYGKRLIVVDPKMKDYLRKLENAVSFGMPLLMQDVGEELDPALEPVLAKSFKKSGTRTLLKIGDKEVDYNANFKFYLTTKVANPHYTPEVSTKTTIVNFVVREQGLQAQLLGIVVQKEEPRLESQKSELVVKVAAAKKTLTELEDEILRLLFNVEGSLLDDEEIVLTLQRSKQTSEEVTQQLRVSEETEKKIDAARGHYKPVAKMAAVLFFVLVDLAKVDPMYQFSLEAYVSLFIKSIEESRASQAPVLHAPALAGGPSAAEKELQGRIDDINAHHMWAVYTYATRGLFVKHKLLFSFLMCIRKLQSEGRVLPEEFDFFQRGGTVLDKAAQPENPCREWLPEGVWDNVTELDKLSNFEGLVRSFEQNERAWREWYMAEAPEKADLPGEWESKCDDLQRMVIVRSVRQDRCLLAAQSFVETHLGPQYVDPPGFNLREVIDGSEPSTPLVFILSPGVDPVNELQGVADERGIKLSVCALGQGQEALATNLIEQGAAHGHYVFLANCHLMLSWMPKLEKVLEEFAAIAAAAEGGAGAGSPGAASLHPDFRLFLSSDPSPHFPISILQRAVKMTSEPPRGLRANLLRLYGLVTPEQFNRCTQGLKYRKLLFCLCWTHAVLIERRKFRSLGWNVAYDFNLSDFTISADVLQLYLDDYPDTTPWEALRYIIGSVNYGGRVSEALDRRLLMVYIDQFFNNSVITVPGYSLCETDFDDKYRIPDDGDLEVYRQHVRSLPSLDHPSVLGQHPNAEISSLNEDAREMLDTLLTLQPQRASATGMSPQEQVLELAADLIEQAPAPFDMEAIADELEERPDPVALKTVLMQELERYNRLITTLRRSLFQLRDGLQGLVVITPELEQVFSSLLKGRVPDAWGFAYPSLKGLGSWMRDLLDRVEQMRRWAEERIPNVFWLSGFTYPTGLLTALLQTTARRTGNSIDALRWDFIVLNQDEDTITQPPPDGVYVRGLFLEGARWDYDAGCLEEPFSMQLYCPMPLIHFKPVDSKAKLSRSTYSCPLYMYPIRVGSRERPSYMISIDLKPGAREPDYWVKRGTALLLSTAD